MNRGPSAPKARALPGTLAHLRAYASVLLPKHLSRPVRLMATGSHIVDHKQPPRHPPNIGSSLDGLLLRAGVPLSRRRSLRFCGPYESWEGNFVTIFPIVTIRKALSTIDLEFFVKVANPMDNEVNASSTCCSGQSEMVPVNER